MKAVSLLTNPLYNRKNKKAIKEMKKETKIKVNEIVQNYILTNCGKGVKIGFVNAYIDATCMNDQNYGAKSSAEMRMVWN